MLIDVWQATLIEVWQAIAAEVHKVSACVLTVIPPFKALAFWVFNSETIDLFNFNNLILFFIIF